MPTRAPIVSTVLIAMLAWPWGAAMNALDADARDAQALESAPALSLKPAGPPQLQRPVKCSRKVGALIAADPDETGTVDDEGLASNPTLFVTCSAGSIFQLDPSGGLIESGVFPSGPILPVHYRLRC